MSKGRLQTARSFLLAMFFFAPSEAGLSESLNLPHKAVSRIPVLVCVFPLVLGGDVYDSFCGRQLNHPTRSAQLT
jgi:hypothetical protein